MFKTLQMDNFIKFVRAVSEKIWKMEVYLGTGVNQFASKNNETDKFC